MVLQRLFLTTAVVMCSVVHIPLYTSFTDWTEYPADPVYNPGRAYYPSIAYDANRFNDNSAYYKMWYEANGQMGLAYSDDGINWTPQALTGLPNVGAHPDVQYDPNGFGGGAYTYKMWFWDPSQPLTSISAIQFSQSTDGLNWTTPISIAQDPLSPLVTGISPGYFYHLYGPGDINYYPQNTAPIAGQPLSYPYVMYFDTATEGAGPGTSVEQTGLAYSLDGLFWTRYGTEPVVIPSGDISQWDGQYTYQPAIIYANGIWHMYYSGSNGQPIGSDGNTTAHGIGHATSSDGINWVRDTDPIFYILDGVPWRNNRTYTPEVILAPFCTTGQQPTVTQMWFTGANSSDIRAIGYATMPCPTVLPPPSFTGTLIKNQFLNRTEYVLVATWAPSPSPHVSWYRIYAHGEVVEQIAASSPAQFIACSCAPNGLESYTIVAVDAQGQESIPVPLTRTLSESCS